MWKRTLAFIALIVFLANAQVPLGPCTTVTAVENLSSANVSNSCNIQTSGFTAGLYTTVSNFQNCGVCLLITGPTGTAIVTVVDTCTGSCPGQNLVLSSDAYRAVTNSTIPPSVQYQMISCSLNTSLKYIIQTGSSQNWFALQVTNSKIGITKVEISTQTAQEWISLNRESYNYWSCSSVANSTCANFQVPLSVRTTGLNGEVLTDTNVLTENANWPTTQDLTTPLVYGGTVQFTQITASSPDCKNSSASVGASVIASSATISLAPNSTKTGTLGKTSQASIAKPSTSVKNLATSASQNQANPTSAHPLASANTVQNSSVQIASQVLFAVLFLILALNWTGQ